MEGERRITGSGYQKGIFLLLSSLSSPSFHVPSSPFLLDGISGAVFKFWKGKGRLLVESYQKGIFFPPAPLSLISSSRLPYSLPLLFLLYVISMELSSKDCGRVEKGYQRGIFSPSFSPLLTSPLFIYLPSPV